MAYHRLGKPAEARNWLKKAPEAHAKQTDPALADLSLLAWVDQLQWQLLYREAEALLKAEPKK